jgi:hypothetical protein
VRVDVTGDRVADFAVLIKNCPGLTAGDFILDDIL